MRRYNRYILSTFQKLKMLLSTKMVLSHHDPGSNKDSTRFDYHPNVINQSQRIYIVADQPYVS